MAAASLTWLGHASFRLDSPNGKRIYVDPWLDNGKKAYFAGDTCVFGDMELIGRIYAPDLAVLPIGGHFTMDPREAAVACELLGVKRVVPSHYGTFPLLKGTPAELKELAEGVEVHTIEPGESVEL